MPRKSVERGARNAGAFKQMRKVGAGNALAAGKRQHTVLQTFIDEMIFKFALVLEVALRLAARRLVKRRLRDEEMAAFDQLRHLAIEEGEQQRADMCAVDIGVGHDDDFVVAQFVGIELLASDTGAERRD